MVYDHIGGMRNPLRQDLVLEFCRNQNKVIIILTETHINHDYTKGFLVLLHQGLEGITEVETDPKRRFMSFKGTLSNDRVLRIYPSSAYSTREYVARGRFFEGLQYYMEIKLREMKTK